MARYHAWSFAALNQSLPVADRLTLIHQRLQGLIPGIERVAFALYQPRKTRAGRGVCAPHRTRV